MEESDFSNNVRIGDKSFTKPYNYHFVKNQTTNDGITVLLKNGENNLSVYRSNSNLSNYQQIEAYKSQYPDIKINQSKMTANNNLDIFKTVALINGKIVVKYYFVKDNTTYSVTTYGNKVGTDEDVKGIVNSIK